MRIVDRQTFLAMPAETLFSKYEPFMFGELLIKGDTCNGSNGIPIDFMYQGIADAVEFWDANENIDILESAEKTGQNIDLDFDCWSRDGLFDLDQQFAVWSEHDVAKLITRLQSV